ncbi:30S ribosomal protein S2 [Patescibacteria group bacterium]|nr:30S ribosomal protein S2 [Patescibacteria group bacterium]
MSFKIPSLDEMLKSGVHFGHVVSKWHPKAESYIYTIKNNVHIINLEKTQESLESSFKKIDEVVKSGKKVLFVGTRKQSRELVKKYSEVCDMPYVNLRWIGGMFTNFKTVLNSIKKLNKLEEEKETTNFSKYTKKESIVLTREITKMNKLIGGIKGMKELPGAVFLVSVKNQKTAVLESKLKNIPIIGICDTNTNPTPVDYPIPANDEAVSSIELILDVVSKQINESKKELKENKEKKDKEKKDSEKE